MGTDRFSENQIWSCEYKYYDPETRQDIFKETEREEWYDLNDIRNEFHQHPRYVTALWTRLGPLPHFKGKMVEPWFGKRLTLEKHPQKLTAVLKGSAQRRRLAWDNNTLIN